MPVGRAMFDVNPFNESPLWREKPDFWPVSKFNTGSLPLPDNPAGNKIWNERRLWRLLKKHLRHQFS